MLVGLVKFAKMEGSRSRRVEKRGYEQSVEDQDDLPGSKKPKLPALARFYFIIFAYIVSFDEFFCSCWWVFEFDLAFILLIIMWFLIIRSLWAFPCFCFMDLVIFNSLWWLWENWENGHSGSQVGSSGADMNQLLVLGELMINHAVGFLLPH